HRHLFWTERLRREVSSPTASVEVFEPHRAADRQFNSTAYVDHGSNCTPFKIARICAAERITSGDPLPLSRQQRCVRGPRQATELSLPCPIEGCVLSDELKFKAGCVFLGDARPPPAIGKLDGSALFYRFFSESAHSSIV